jgi:hypothetical protein
VQLSPVQPLVPIHRFDQRPRYQISQLPPSVPPLGLFLTNCYGGHTHTHTHTVSSSTAVWSSRRLHSPICKRFDTGP